MLHLYLDQAHTQQISDNFTTTSYKDETTMNGSTGGTEQRQLWVWNDNSAAKTYTGITLTAVNDDVNVDVEYAPDVSGAPGTWSESLTLPDGDYSTAYPIWRRVIIAVHTDSTTRTNIKHKITATEYAK